ncbi:hypothetical protein B0T14DRAFT_282300 [Immersiella caudata]|uniref:Uncharacterized protein n=1 Tax=Immersiella caudata TaxID=314043 RepID=A0AA40BU12_9PEZI|nr:hypothetical protein B0T14DRAFT_282300 [Immersiella caudata]
MAAQCHLGSSAGPFMFHIAVGMEWVAERRTTAGEYPCQSNCCPVAWRVFSQRCWRDDCRPGTRNRALCRPNAKRSPNKQRRGRIRPPVPSSTIVQSGSYGPLLRGQPKAVGAGSSMPAQAANEGQHLETYRTRPNLATAGWPAVPSLMTRNASPSSQTHHDDEAKRPAATAAPGKETTGGPKIGPLSVAGPHHCDVRRANPPPEFAVINSARY